MKIGLIEDEIWLPVVGFEKQYLVSNYSRVYSIGYKRILSPNRITAKQRYKRVRLSNRIVRETHCVHIISATAFIPNPLNLPEVNHKDDNRENNHISNFEWTTHHENVTHGKITRNGEVKSVGVCMTHNKKRYRARIYHNKKHIWIGVYDTEKDASDAYQKYCTDNGISLKYVA